MLKILAHLKVAMLLPFLVLVALVAIGLVLLSLPGDRHAPVAVVQPTQPARDISFDNVLPDFDAITDIDQKKQSFFAFLQDYIEEENRRILASREHLQEFYEILETQSGLSVTEQKVLEAISTEYRMQGSGLSPLDLVEELLVRVDIIPVSLALAQAATESGWGTSRFAREGNNIFGQWCFDEGCGLVPGQRADEKSHEVRAFASVDASVQAYFRNINTNPTYEYLRELRAKMRQQGKALDSTELVLGLGRYSERGHVYIAELQDIIRINDLLAHDERS